MKFRNLLASAAALAVVTTSAPAAAQVDHRTVVEKVHRDHKTDKQKRALKANKDNRKVVKRKVIRTRVVAPTTYSMVRAPVTQHYYNQTWNNRYSADRYDRNRTWHRDTHRFFAFSPSIFLGFNAGTRYYSGTCGVNRVQVALGGLPAYSGRVVLARSFYRTGSSTGLYLGQPLVGRTFYPSSRICVNRNDLATGRVALVHDVNSNGIFDPMDGIGRMTYGAYGYGGYPILTVSFNYGLNF
jgi:hypothetical protein